MYPVGRTGARSRILGGAKLNFGRAESLAQVHSGPKRVFANHALLAKCDCLLVISQRTGVQLSAQYETSKQKQVHFASAKEAAKAQLARNKPESRGNNAGQGGMHGSKPGLESPLSRNE